jgi:NAD-specific glutamate dehydrogenase
MKQERKVYPIKMDAKTYQTFNTIAKAKGITMVMAMRHALGLFIAENLMMLNIVDAGYDLSELDDRITSLENKVGEDTTPSPTQHK